jgi:hypothetical protein
VCSLPTEAPGLIGTDFVYGVGVKIDFEGGKVSLSEIGRALRVRNDSVTECPALTVFVQSKEGHRPHLCERETRQTDVQFPPNSHHEPTTDQCRTWLVKAKENVTLAPRCRQSVTGILETGKGQRGPLLVCLEPAQIPIEGILPARALSRIELHTCEATSQSASNATGNSSSRVCVMLTNFSDEELILSKATVLGVAEEIS